MKRELKEDLLQEHGDSPIESHKAYPDEKGTESGGAKQGTISAVAVTRHIPMKRELKV